MMSVRSSLAHQVFLELVGDDAVPLSIQVQIISKQRQASIPVDRLCQIEHWNRVSITDLANLALACAIVF